VTRARSETTAIIGSGPAGLSCAYYLSIFDRKSTIFECERVAGGLLATGIPPFRLPRYELNRQIDDIVSDCSEIHLSKCIDHLDELPETTYAYVFVATGAQEGRVLAVDGETLPGVVDALLFLRSYCYGDGQVIASGKRVAVIGGGHTAFDAARAAARAGASGVILYYRRSVAEMGAYAEEIEAARSEGVLLEPLCMPDSFLARNGTLSGMRVSRMRLSEADSEGRTVSVPIEGKEFDVECDLVVRAVGQVLPDLPLHEQMPRSPWGGISADFQDGATRANRVFAGGDCVLGASSVLRAVDSGKRAALAIDKLLGGVDSLPPREDRSIVRPFGLFNPSE